MALKLSNLESFDPSEIEKLRSCGISTTDDVVRQAASRESRRRLAKHAGVAEASLLRLARAADLLRIAGINEAHTRLLDALGAGCVEDLRLQDAAVLIKAMRRKNVELTLVRSVPPESNLARWIADANAVPIVLET